MASIVLPASSGYPALTRRELRRMVGEDVGGEMFVVGVAGNVTPTTFTMPELIDNGVDSSRFIDFWVLIEGEERRLTEVDSETGTATVHRPIDSLANGMEVEVYRWKPSMIDKAINDGLSRCKYVQWVQVTMESGEYEYDVSSLPYILTKADLLGVYLRYGEDQSDLPWSDLTYDGSTRTLRVRPATYGTGTSLWLKTKRSYGPLNADTDTTDIPELWGRAAARLALFDTLLNRSGAGKENAWMRATYNKAQMVFRRQSELHQPRESRKIQMSRPVWGPGYI